MKPVLLVLFGLVAVLTVAGLTFAFTRPLRWPSNVRALEWRRIVADAVESEPEKEATA
jgi:hypothetical protein